MRMLLYENTSRSFLPEGFILFPILIILQLTALIGLYALSTATASLKNNNHLWIRSESLHAAKQISRMISLNINRECTILKMSPTELVDKPLSWWQQHACTGHANKLRYYYITESLGLDPCARVANTSYVGDYYRMTLFALPDTMKNAKILIQTTIVNPASTEIRCQTSPHLVSLGQQTQQEM